MAKKKIHEFVIRVRFDKPCTAAHAIAQVKDNIHGNFYPYQHEDHFPGEGWIKSFRHLPMRAR
ncbi:hypothetical protein NKJ04_17690 [Mesorhizobium sp. M0618]|uniref:hypothetical protein n=1 Tax=Mesorhizobium sp. M0618 TaxID=2956972 RepID=UPI00333ADC7F